MKKSFLIPNIALTREPLKETEEPLPADGLILPGVQAAHDIDRVKSITHRFRVGYADRIGLRDSMEDKIVICGNFRNHPEEDYFAIFDGHAGKEASAYCADHMHKILESLLNDQQGQDLPSCITQSFSVTHERMKTYKTGEGKLIESGTTSLIAFFQDDDLFVANAGDSRAVFCQNKTSVIITEDHKPTSEREFKRITSIPGGFVIKNRVQGKLAVARAIGDYKLNPYVTETPDVFGPFHWKDPRYEFLILACDGLWDVMEDQKACDYVRHCRDPREAAVKLRDWAYDERSKDNISVVVIWFPGFVPEDPIIEEPKQKNPSSLMSFSLLQNKKQLPENKLSDSEDDDDEHSEDDDEDEEDEDDNEDEEDDNEDDEDDEDDDEDDEEEEIKRDRKVEEEEEIKRDRKVEEEEKSVKEEIKCKDKENSKKEDKHNEEAKLDTQNAKYDSENESEESEESEGSISDGENEENGINRKEPEKIKEKVAVLNIRSAAALGDTYESPKDHENGSGTDPTTEKLVQHSSSKCFLVKLPST